MRPVGGARSGATSLFSLRVGFLILGIDLEEGLGPEDQPAIRPKVVTLKVYFIAISLRIHQGEVWSTESIGPCGHDRVRFSGVLDHLLVGTEKEMLGERLGLHARHVDEPLRELLLEVLFTGAWHRGDEPTLREGVGIFNKHFTNTLSIDLESCDVTATEDPTFEIHAVMGKVGASFDTEEFWVKRFPIHKHRIGL